MSGLKEIRRRIGSVKNTKQITRAMKLVSAAKLRRAQEAAENGRSFGNRLQEVLSSVLEDLPEDFSHPMIETRSEVKKRRVLVIAGERGLCGGYNSSMAKALKAEADSASCELDFLIVGQRGVLTADRYNWPVVEEHVRLPEDVSQWPVSEITERLITAFAEGECDEVVVFYTKFQSTMTQVVTREVLLPFSGVVGTVSADESEGEEAVLEQGQNKYDPSPEEIVSQLLPLLLMTKVSQAGTESKASEHAARMTAMDSATRNADDLIEKLRLFYNRARQSAITRELIDIVGGAEALK